jgi:hypothetical protein
LDTLVRKADPEWATLLGARVLPRRLPLEPFGRSRRPPCCSAA